MARKRKDKAQEATKSTEIKSTENEALDLARKYRPTCLNDFYGNMSLKKSLEKAKIPSQALFYGDPGSGKTTLARIFANQLGCSEFDLKEIDTGDFRGIDTVREIRRIMGKKPMKGNVRVFIIDEVHMLGRGGDSSKNEAQNALLKALEEPPKNCYFFLCTTDPQNLISTIKSRCVQYRVQALSEKQTFNLVTNIAKKEDVDLPKKVGLQIARDSLGHPREALKILEKILHLDEDDMLETAKQEAERREQSITLCRALIKNKSWKEIAGIIKSIDEEAETVRRVIRGYFASVLLNGDSSAFIVLDCLKQPFYNIDGKNELIRSLYEIHSEMNE